MLTIDADIDEIARTIWDTLFGLTLERAPEGAQFDTESVVASLVHIDGAWQGAVMLQCSMALATSLATAMFMAEQPPTSEEIRDAMGELTNMVAGNLKALLPGPSRISLPATAFGSDYKLGVVGTVPTATVSFICTGHLFVITLLERSPLSGTRNARAQ